MAPAKKMPPKGGANAVSNLIQNITNRYRVTAREARDIVTAVSTLSETRKSEAGGTKADAKKNLVTQLKEVGTAATTGKKGTTSQEYYPKYSSMSASKKRK